MTHYKDITNPLACIFGNILTGNRKKENPPHKDNWIRIFEFLCEINKECDCKSRQIAFEEYQTFELYGEIPSSMSGHRAIIEPANGYKGPGFKTKKKPKKVGRHTSGFKVNGYPAVCYFDNFETRQRPIRLAQIRTNRI